MSTDDLDTARAFTLAAQVAELESQLADTKRYYFQTMLVIATLAGGEIRLSKIDYLATRGRTLATFVDPKTGDRVFVAKTSEREGDHARVDD